MEELTGNISHSGIEGLIIELNSFKALRHGQEEEKPSFWMGPSDAFRHVFSQKVQKMVTLVLIQCYTLLQISVQSATG